MGDEHNTPRALLATPASGVGVAAILTAVEEASDDLLEKIRHRTMLEVRDLRSGETTATIPLPQLGGVGAFTPGGVGRYAAVFGGDYESPVTVVVDLLEGRVVRQVPGTFLAVSAGVGVQASEDSWSGYDLLSGENLWTTAVPDNVYTYLEPSANPDFVTATGGSSAVLEVSTGRVVTEADYSEVAVDPVSSIAMFTQRQYHHDRMDPVGVGMRFVDAHTGEVLNTVPLEQSVELDLVPEGLYDGAVWVISERRSESARFGIIDARTGATIAQEWEGMPVAGSESWVAYYSGAVELREASDPTAD